MDQFDLIMLQRKLDKLDKLDDIETLCEAMIDLGAAIGDLEEKLDETNALLEAVLSKSKPAPKKVKLVSVTNGR